MADSSPMKCLRDINSQLQWSSKSSAINEVLYLGPIISTPYIFQFTRPDISKVEKKFSRFYTEWNLGCSGISYYIFKRCSECAEELDKWLLWCLLVQSRIRQIVVYWLYIPTPGRNDYVEFKTSTDCGTFYYLSRAYISFITYIRSSDWLFIVLTQIV